MIELPAVQSQDPRSFWELRHGEIRAVARRVTAAVSSFFQLGLRIISESWRQLRDRVIALLPEKMAIRLDPRIMLIRIILEMPLDKRADFTCNILELISPQIDQNIKNTFIKTVAESLTNDEGKLVRSILPFVTIEMYSSKNIEITQKKVASIPVNDREEVIRISRLLMTPEMTAYDRARMLREVAASFLLITSKMIANEIASILREVAAIPVNQKEEVIRRSRLLITPEMNTYDRVRILREVAAIVANEREEVIRVPPRIGMNVHENDRDQRMKAAIELLFDRQKDITIAEIHEAKDNFVAYLKKCSIDSEKKALAQRALLEPRKNNQDFGPLINDEGFTILGLQMSGADLIGRLRIFISKLPENEQINALTSMISALSDSYNDCNTRVCNQGKTQRLVVAVLQGRLPGVNIEGDVISITTEAAMEMFFNIKAHQEIDKFKDLIEAANQFCNEHVLVNKDTFILEIKEYARVQEIEN
ncbi:hypothetical protein RHABOEDO_001749 [Candidatus Rhabdochlamydia oedothoracis]|uniref:Uncharacterized protein n=1 Tax=Candidatus Rhabdochlamydia oedothoracis TaxID=2720720 RepID=A0ABX8V2D2_9BACT|nr:MULTISPECIES: hypothetical protein [Rhabdochlamydia]KAG6559119.1 hypothetical protein RHOW815_000875 [Candidatus Rhabdochlamydia sp. W815]QYF49412.1 hypothetical protein RHABOEDO_001749 [Candidatus Rhabdochlamydia oedothoracis]